MKLEVCEQMEPRYLPISSVLLESESCKFHEHFHQKHEAKKIVQALYTCGRWRVSETLLYSFVGTSCEVGRWGGTYLDK